MIIKCGFLKLSRPKNGPRKLSHFHDIVSEYGRVLGEYSYMVYGRPKSKLPYGIPEIKEAIIKVALESLDEPDFIEQLKEGYAELATFIDDEAAIHYERARLAMEIAFGKGPSPPPTPELAQVIEDFGAAGKAQNAIIEEMKIYRATFNEVFEKLKAKIN